MDGYHAACGQMENTVLVLRRNPCSYCSGAEIKRTFRLISCEEKVYNL